MIKTSGLQLIALLSITISTTVMGQSTIPAAYRGDQSSVLRGVIETNNIVTNYRNHGELSRWGDIPWGQWNGGSYIDGIGFIVAGQVAAPQPGTVTTLDEYRIWVESGGNPQTDTLLNPVIINYRDAGVRLSPYTGQRWGWLPIGEFENRNRVSPNPGEYGIIPTTSKDPTSWPSQWPDKLYDTSDPGWSGEWNGLLGKGVTIQGEERFYVMDDHSDLEYGVDLETDGPHSPLGVYLPSLSDPTMGGLGLQVEVRHFQWEHQEAENILLTHYRITNVGERPLEKLWNGLIIDFGLGYDEDDDYVVYDAGMSMIYAWDMDGIGMPTRFGESAFETGYVGIMILESFNKDANGIDDDHDGIVDESDTDNNFLLFNDTLSIGQFVNANYFLKDFEATYGAVEDRPAYQKGIWFNTDEDMDWEGFTDENENGLHDAGEPLNDDLGMDGLGPENTNYPGPDMGEGDGFPTDGEPDFNKEDPDERDDIGMTGFDLSTRPFYEAARNLNDDTWIFRRITQSSFSNPDYIIPGTGVDEPYAFITSGDYGLAPNTSTNFITALVFGEDKEALFTNAKYARNELYGTGFKPSGVELVTANEEEFYKIDGYHLSQNYPNPFNPGTAISYELSTASHVSLKVFDALGREVANLVSGNKSAGLHTVNFDASSLSSGVYIYRMEAGNFIQTRKMMLIK